MDVRSGRRNWMFNIARSDSDELAGVNAEGNDQAKGDGDIINAESE